MIADDHDVVRSGLRSILSLADGIILVAEAADGQAALALALDLEPDVVLMDLQMPSISGIAATEAICARLPETRVVMLTSFVAEEHVLPAIQAGASGYLLKDASGAEIVAAVHAVARGDPLLDPVAMQQLIEWVAARPQDPSPPPPLTPREMDVLRLVVRGMSNKQIAGALGTAENTVKEQLSAVFAKLGLKDRTQAALFAVRTGLVRPDE